MKRPFPAHTPKSTRLDSQTQVIALRASLALCLLVSALGAVVLALEVESNLDHIFAPWNQPHTPGCAVGVFRHGQTVYARGFGVADLENNAPITPDTPFDIASISKQFTATAIVLLAQRGKLSLDDDVRKFIPEFPSYGRTITLRHLIHHTSGLRDYDTLVSLHGTQDETVVHNQDALEVLCRQKHLNFNPGEQHSYSNSGYLLMALMVERITGQPLRQFLAENIFVPLDMSTAQVHDDHAKIIANRAIGYAKDGQGRLQIDMSDWVVTGDGAIFASIRDFAKWDQNFYECKVGGPQFKALQLGSIHGFGISVLIRQMSKEVLQVEQGLLYPALYRLQDQGWIESEWGFSDNNRKAKFYKPTPAGRKQLAEERSNWERLSGAINLVLKPA